MDSLTQIVLGAAVGEVVLGRRVGNRAMLWGGICGTLPDLDVLANAVTDPMSALAYHRAFTHSLAFAVLSAPVIGLGIHRFYGGREGPLRNGWVWPALLAALYLILLVGSYLMPIEIYRIPVVVALVTGAFALFFLTVGVLRHLRGYPAGTPNAGWRGWSLLAFAAVVTHPLLDCFTAYGTQILQPLHDHRAAWNTISVADPLYTLPFLALLLVARARVRGTVKRRRVNLAGLIVSSAYLLFTVANHFNVAHIFDDTLAAEGIVAERTVVNPTILNNILWSGTAREAGSDVMYWSQYSLFDEQRRFQPPVRIPGNHAWLAPYAADRDMRILRWFTNDLYGVLPADTTGRVQVNDLRFGLINDDPADLNSYVFSWTVDTTARPVRVVSENAGPREGVDPSEWFVRLWERLKGI